MSDTLESLRHKVNGATDLASVVRTMKAIAASSIGQYESAVESLSDYFRTVDLALAACYRQNGDAAAAPPREPPDSENGAVVFGSDQGLIGQFNENLADFAAAQMRSRSGTSVVWTVGERIETSLSASGVVCEKLFATPGSAAGITPLLGRILEAVEPHLQAGKMRRLTLFHNKPRHSALYEPAALQILPLDRSWRREKASLPWPTGALPQAIGEVEPALIREYLFVSLFQACAESLASENACRLAAMQRAEKNIAELLEQLTSTFHRLRQSSIDSELFDVVAGFEALR